MQHSAAVMTCDSKGQGTALHRVQQGHACGTGIQSVLSYRRSKSCHCDTCLQILFNPHVGTKFVSSEDEQMLAFRSVLIQVRGSSCRRPALC